MTRPRLRFGSELLPVGLILASLAGTSLLVVSMHQRASSTRKRVPPQEAPPLAVAPPIPSPVQLPPPPAPPPPEPVPAPPVEDPTPLAVARLGAEEAEQLLAAQAADRRAEGLERSIKAAKLESDRWKRREHVVLGQVASLTERVRSKEQEVEALAMERDVLAHELEASKAALTKAQTRSSFAVLPNRAPNGTWRRPIVIECKNGCATLQPGGPSFNMLDLSALLGARSSPLLLAVVRELSRIQGTTGPDGAPSVPYIFFVVRPDGIRPYYDARSRLESLGIAFGYELVDQDMEIDFPDLDHPSEWDGSPPLPKFPALASLGEPAPGGGRGRDGGHGSGSRTGTGTRVDDFRWPPGSSGSNTDQGVESALDRNRRLVMGGDDSSRLGRSFEDRSLATGRDGGLSGWGRAGDPTRNDLNAGLGSEAPAERRGGLGIPETPGMLPPRGGSLNQRPGMLPPIGGPEAGSNRIAGIPSASGSGTGAGARAVAEALARSGRLGPMGMGPESSSTPGPNPGGLGRPGQPNGIRPTVPQSPHPEDASNLDGVSLLGRSPSEGAPFRPSGLLPGEPGAPPEGQLEPNHAPGVQSGSPAQGRGQGLGQGQGIGTYAGSHGGSSGSGSGTGSSGGGESGGKSGDGGMPSSGSRGPLRIEVPMEIVVACGPNGVVIHPGGYNLTQKTLKGKDPVFTTSLKTIVRLRQQVDPMIRPVPSIKFLVEPGGGETYRDARRQTVLSGIDWPTVLQVADTQVLDFLPRERF